MADPYGRDAEIEALGARLMDAFAQKVPDLRLAENAPVQVQFRGGGTAPPPPAPAATDAVPSAPPREEWVTPDNGGSDAVPGTVPASRVDAAQAADVALFPQDPRLQAARDKAELDLYNAPSGGSAAYEGLKSRTVDTRTVSPQSARDIEATRAADLAKARLEAGLVSATAPERMAMARVEADKARDAADVATQIALRQERYHQDQKAALDRVTADLDSAQADRRSGFERMFGTSWGGKILGYTLASMSGVLSVKSGYDPVKAWADAMAKEHELGIAGLKDRAKSEMNLYTALMDSGMSAGKALLTAKDLGYQAKLRELASRIVDMENGPLTEVFNRRLGKLGGAAGAQEAPGERGAELDALFDPTGRYVGPAAARPSGVPGGAPWGAESGYRFTGRTGIDYDGGGYEPRGNVSPIMQYVMDRTPSASGAASADGKPAKPEKGGKSATAVEYAPATTEELVAIVQDADTKLLQLAAAPTVAAHPETYASAVHTLQGIADAGRKAIDARAKAAEHDAAAERVTTGMVGGGGGVSLKDKADLALRSRAVDVQQQAAAGRIALPGGGRGGADGEFTNPQAQKFTHELKDDVDLAKSTRELSGMLRRMDPNFLQMAASDIAPSSWQPQKWKDLRSLARIVRDSFGRSKSGAAIPPEEREELREMLGGNDPAALATAVARLQRYAEDYIRGSAATPARSESGRAFLQDWSHRAGLAPEVLGVPSAAPGTTSTIGSQAPAYQVTPVGP